MALSPAIPLPPLTRIAIVGAGGPSGLVALRQLLVAGVPPSSISAYEGRATAGGVWNYEAEPGEMLVDWRREGPPVVRAKSEVDSPGANGPSGEWTIKERDADA
jgi:cation diffusion facilitator CzcD-associated flavoprotein CzcO